MAVPFDVAARLAEGLPVVADVQTYVWACHSRGYQHADLTSHGAQVGEWYGTEDGLDLGALDADSAALNAAAKTLAAALGLARAQVAELPQAWTGPGATAAADFLRQHCDSASGLVDAVASAAESATILRDELWRIVDHKVEVTAAMADRTQGQRSSWLAAARSVLAGDPGAQDSAQVLDGQVKPFVDNEIGAQWIPEMRATVAAAAEAYRIALGDLVGGPATRFDIPGDLGPPGDHPTARASAPAPVSVPSPVPTLVSPMGAAGSAPASPPASASPNTLDPLVSPALAPAPSPIPPAPSPIPPAEVPVPAAPTAAAPTGAMPGLGSAGDMPARLADALGGLLGTSVGPRPDSRADLSEPAELDIPAADRPLAGDPADGDPAEETPADDAADEDPVDDPAEETPDTGEPAESAPDPVEGDCPAESAEQTPAVSGAPAAQPPPPPAAAEQAPLSASGSSDGETPCEIAADELPQAGL